MTSHTTREFRAALSKLPGDVRQQARDAYRRFSADPQHPGPRFKEVHATLPVYSARIGRGYRAVGVLEKETIVWFWIGSHDDYDQLLKTL